MRRAVFLDRDGVLVADDGCIASMTDVRILPGVPAALRRLGQAGFLRVVVTNQSVVARGLATPETVEGIHAWLAAELERLGGSVDGFFYCPHHPEATLPNWRVACECRKPRPGLILRAARELGIDCSSSFVIGDRGTDIAAGRAAGCTTVLLTTGRHLDPPIVADLDGMDCTPHRTCRDLEEAALMIIREPG